MNNSYFFTLLFLLSICLNSISAQKEEWTLKKWTPEQYKAEQQAHDDKKMAELRALRAKNNISAAELPDEKLKEMDSKALQDAITQVFLPGSEDARTKTRAQKPRPCYQVPFEQLKPKMQKDYQDHRIQMINRLSFGAGLSALAVLGFGGLSVARYYNVIDENKSWYRIFPGLSLVSLGLFAFYYDRRNLWVNTPFLTDAELKRVYDEGMQKIKNNA